ncbi:GFA family protein [Proteobacteria bacterium 005FR1]|nr:GFA family protein [Proteobacteria bacterium 005FR1]
MTCSGACHCRAVRFEAEVPDEPEVVRCNCSICRMSGFLHLIVPKARFKLLSGEDQLTTYTFNTGVAKHTFCRTCGIKPFYTPRSNPDGIDINVNCLDEPLKNARYMDFDGQHWEQNAHKVAHMSREE